MLQDLLEAAVLVLGHIHLQEETVKRVNTFIQIYSIDNGV